MLAVYGTSPESVARLKEEVCKTLRQTPGVTEDWVDATADQSIQTATILLNSNRHTLENLARRIAGGTSQAPEEISRLAEDEVKKLREEAN